MNYCSVCCFNAVAAAGGTCGSCSARLENERLYTPLMTNTGVAIEPNARLLTATDLGIEDDTAEHAPLITPEEMAAAGAPASSVAWASMFPATCPASLEVGVPRPPDPPPGKKYGEGPLFGPYPTPEGQWALYCDMPCQELYGTFPDRIDAEWVRVNQGPTRSMTVVDEAASDGLDVFANAKCWSSRVINLGSPRVFDPGKWSTMTKEFYDNCVRPPQPDGPLEDRLRAAIGEVMRSHGAVCKVPGNACGALRNLLVDAVLDVVGRPVGVVGVPGKSEAELELALASIRLRQQALGLDCPKPPVEPETADHRPYLRELSREELDYLLSVRADPGVMDRVLWYCQAAALIQRNGLRTGLVQDQLRYMVGDWSRMTDEQRELCRRAVWRQPHQTEHWSPGSLIRSLLEAPRDKSDRPPNS